MVIKVRLVMISGETGKRHKGSAGVLEIHILIWMVITWVYVGIRIHHTVYISALYCTCYILVLKKCKQDAEQYVYYSIVCTK